jgi:hypothetical protein
MLVGKLGWNRPLETPRSRRILKWILEKQGLRVWIGCI